MKNNTSTIIPLIGISFDEIQEGDNATFKNKNHTKGINAINVEKLNLF